MAINPDEDTEFNDALRKLGILPPKPSPPRTPSPPPPPTLEERLEDYDPAQLRELAEDARDDDEARAIESYRRQRIAEIYKEHQRARFGRVFPIGREDYKREVTEASAVDEGGEEMKGKGTGVVCFLYKDGLTASDRAFQHIRTLAARYPRTKFVSIVGDKCIPNYPDRHLPTIFIYRKGEIINQQVAWGVEKEKTLEELEALLVLTGAVIPPDRPPPSRNLDEDADLFDSDEDIARSATARTNTKATRNIRGPAREDDKDDDSDFDL